MPARHTTCAGDRPDGGRWITEAEAARLLAALPPRTVSYMAAFSLTTGLRARSVREPVWSEVVLSRRIARLYADGVKNNTDLTVPLGRMVSTVIRRRIGSHATHVFGYRGKPLRNINADAWQRAVTRRESPISAGTTSGIPGFHGMCRTVPACRNSSNRAGGSHTGWYCVIPSWPAITREAQRDMLQIL